MPSCTWVAGRPSCRLRVKTSIAKPTHTVVGGRPSCRLPAKSRIIKSTQEPLLDIDDWEAEEAMGGRRMVYLVTFPHPKRNSTDSGVPLVAPYRRSKSEMLQCLLDAAAHPEYTDGRSIATRASVEILRACVFREFHRPQASGLAFPHDHMTVLGARQFHFLPVKKALLKRHGLASHWSCSHNG